MKDPQFQAIWHELNQANVELVTAASEKDRNQRIAHLSAAQERAKRADVLLREVLSTRSES